VTNSSTLSDTTAAPAAPSAVETNEDSVSDDTLVLAYLRGNAAAFDTLYERYKGPIYRFLQRQLDESRAHDAFQDTWTKLISTLPNYKRSGKFGAYLFRIAHNVLMDEYRKNKHFVAADDPETESIDQAADVERQVDEQLFRRKLYDEIARLPINQRTVWLIKQESQFSLKEIANLTGSSVEGVKSRLRYANEKLKKGMRRYVRS
jgi:RNA polymerase sigma-70 factor (ECF subfamily)